MGNYSTKVIKAGTKDEAEDYCEKIEKVGYRLIDVSLADEEYGL